MDKQKWNVSVPRRMFNSHVHAKVNAYFDLIDQALDAEITAAQAKFKKPGATTPNSATSIQLDQDRLRLKLYAFATIAVENDKFQCSDEDISSFNTLDVFPAKFYKSIGYVRPVSLPTLQPLHGVPSTPWRFGEFNLTRPFGRYDDRHPLGNHAEGMGERYKGRGFIQLTGLANYTLYSRLAGIPGLATHPELASKPENAARILASYILHNQSRILDALNKRDFIAARRVVNGKKALGWERLAAAYEQGERALQPATAPRTKAPAVLAPNVLPTRLP